MAALIRDFSATYGDINSEALSAPVFSEMLKHDRADNLDKVRGARSRKPSEWQQEATRNRIERIALLEIECAKWPGKSASDIAQTLQNKGQFAGIAIDTLRKDVATAKQSARNRNK
jgi:hypothetical protein